MLSTSDIACRVQRSGSMIHEGIYKQVTVYWLAPSQHATDRALSQIDKSSDPLQAWIDLGDCIHERSIEDKWSC